MIAEREVPEAVASLLVELKGRCNRYSNGVCQNSTCLRRGGYAPGDVVDYEKATCEAREQISFIERSPGERL